MVKMMATVHSGSFSNPVLCNSNKNKKNVVEHETLSSTRGRRKQAVPKRKKGKKKMQFIKYLIACT